MMNKLLERPALLLSVGCALIFAANFRWGVGVVAWIAPVPLLRYLRLTRGWRSRLAFGAALCAAWIATTLKIVTAPLPVVAALPMGLIAAMFNPAAYLAWDRIRRLAPQDAALLAFPAAVVVTEWLQHFTRLASWGAMAYTQVDDLPLLQLASLGGIAAVSFVVAWVAAWLELALSFALGGTSPWGLRQGIAIAAVFLGAHAWGVMRLNAPLDDVSVRVATVGTLATFGGAPPLPDAPARNAIVDTLLGDSARAATAGARLVVWTEVTALVMPGEEETQFLHRVAELARVHSVDVVLIAEVPRHHLNTIYAVTGDVLVFTCMVLLLAVAGWGAVSRMAGSRKSPSVP